jgi:hypothetical protein
MGSCGSKQTNVDDLDYYLSVLKKAIYINDLDGYMSIPPNVFKKNVKGLPFLFWAWLYCILSDDSDIWIFIRKRYPELVNYSVKSDDNLICFFDELKNKLITGYSRDGTYRLYEQSSTCFRTVRKLNISNMNILSFLKKIKPILNEQKSTKLDLYVRIFSKGIPSNVQPYNPSYNPSYIQQYTDPCTIHIASAVPVQSAFSVYSNVPIAQVMPIPQYDQYIQPSAPPPPKYIS